MMACKGPTIRSASTFDAVDLKGIAGEIVGPSMEAGHRLRTGNVPTRPDHVKELDVLVIGGGIAGLTAGWRLSRSGFRDFEIVELEAAPGGKSRSGENPITPYPWGAHYLPVPTPESVVVRQILDEMGLVVGRSPQTGEPIYDPRHLCHAPQERLFVGNRWQPGLSLRSVTGPEDKADVAAFEARLREFRDFRDDRGRSAFTLPMEASSRDESILALDRLSMSDYMNAAGWVSTRLRWYVDYCCRDDYGCSIEETSAWAGWHYFCARGESSEVLTWPEGNGRLVRHLAEAAGDRLKLERMVCRVLPASRPGDRVEVDVLDLKSEQMTQYRCRQVIYGLPRFTAPYVIEGVDREQVQAFTYAPWLVANLTFDIRQAEGRWAGGLLSRQAAWDNVLYDSRSLGYVIATHQDLKISPGSTVLTYYLPFVDSDPSAARRRLQESTWQQLARSVLGDLAQAHPDIVSRVSRLDVMRWGHAMIRPTPGFIWGAARRQSLDEMGVLPGIQFAHSDMSGLSLFEEASYRGATAAERVLNAIGSRGGKETPSPSEV